MPTDIFNRALGIDVSRWQKIVDWQQVKQAGISFAFVKATEGTRVVDPFLERNWAGMKQAGILRGAYHFFRPKEDPQGQAGYFARLFGDDPGEMPPVLDLETHDGLDNLSLISRAEAWLTEVERLLGRRPIIYTAPYFWKDHMRDSSGRPPSWAQNHKFWIAHYTSAERPIIPAGCADWTIWQYTDRGRVPGVNGGNPPVDTNRFNGTLDDLRAWLSSEIGLTPEPEPVAVVEPSVEATPQVTNQVMINAFYELFGQPAFTRIERAGLAFMAVPNSNRKLPYSGPPIGLIPTLTADEKAALRIILAKEGEEPEPPAVVYLKWEHHALPGLHGPADPGGGWVPEAFEVVRSTKVRAIKMLVPDLQPAEVAGLRAINPTMFIMARLFSAQLNRPQGGGTPEGTGRWFANEVADSGDGNNPMNRAYNSGLRYFEVHNEPNLTIEGVGANWRDGAEFARFFNTVVDALKPRYPEAKFGFPGLSPGPTFNVRPIDMWTFLDQAGAAIQRADFMCTHSYWGGDGTGFDVATRELRKFCDRYPGKLVFCTEFSNNSPNVSREQKAEEYARFYTGCRDLPSNLGGLFAYALSWRDDHNSEGFLRLSADKSRWESTPMAGRLGSHVF